MFNREGSLGIDIILFITKYHSCKTFKEFLKNVQLSNFFETSVILEFILGNFSAFQLRNVSICDCNEV